MRAAEDGGDHSTNPTHGWQIHYGADGVTHLTARAATPWQWGLTLTGYGYADLIPVRQPAGLQAEGQRLTYQWDETLDEWWLNDTAGLEQGLTLHTRPVGQLQGQPLRLQMAISGDLRPIQQENASAFADPTGATAFTYDNLQAWDARGQPLVARLTLDNETLALEIEQERHRHLSSQHGSAAARGSEQERQRARSHRGRDGDHLFVLGDQHRRGGALRPGDG